MKKLIIARHGQSQIGDPSVSDMNCPITKQGQRDLAAVAMELIKLDIHPDVIITSPALRARESSEIFAKKLEVDAERILIDENIYQAEKSALFHFVHELDDSYDSVLLMGHNPGVSKLYHVLIDTDVESFGASCVAVVDLDVKTWKRVHFKNATLRKYISPVDLEKPKGVWWRFALWRKQKVVKIELFFVFLIGLIIVLVTVFVVINHTTVKQSGGSGSGLKDALSQ